MPASILHRLGTHAQHWLASLTWFSLAQFFCAAGVAAIPFGLRSLIYTGSAFAGGGFDEFAAFFLYSSELMWLVSFVCLGVALLRDEVIALDFTSVRRFVPFALLLLGSAAAVTPLAHDPMVALLGLYRLLALVAVSGLLMAGMLRRDQLVQLLMISFGLQGVLACAQFLAGGSLGLHFVGESIFTVESLNVAKLGDAVRGMGTLAHANILGGLCALVALLALGQARSNTNFYFWFGLLLLGVFFSFSRAAWLAFFLGCLVLAALHLRRYFWSLLIVLLIFGLLAGIWSDLIWLRADSLVSAGVERSAQIAQAWAGWLDTPLGVGRGGYTTWLATSSPLLPEWQVQPVHNFFLLKLVEESPLVSLTWIGGWIWLTVLAVRSRYFPGLAVLLAALVLALADHYLATSFAGEAVLLFLFAATASGIWSAQSA